MRKVAMLLILCIAVAHMATYGQDGKRLRPFAVGMTLGGNLTKVQLTADCYNIYDNTFLPHPIMGTYFQYRMDETFALCPEMLYYGRGGKLVCRDVSYRLMEHCLGWRIGIQTGYVFPRSLASVYVVYAPELTLIMGGHAEYSSINTGKIDMRLSRSNMKIGDIGAFWGIGAVIPLTLSGQELCLSGEMGYHFNVINSFTNREYTANLTILNTVNLPPSAKGKRYGDGFELVFKIGIPFGRMDESIDHKLWKKRYFL